MERVGKDSGVPFDDVESTDSDMSNLGRSFEMKERGGGLRDSQMKKLKKKPTEVDKMILR
jgi:hypothetical protein